MVFEFLAQFTLYRLYLKECLNVAIKMALEFSNFIMENPTKGISKTSEFRAPAFTNGQMRMSTLGHSLLAAPKKNARSKPQMYLMQNLKASKYERTI